MTKLLVSVLLLIPLAVTAQETAGSESLASTLNVYVFPSEGQEPSQQSKDETACYQWATTNAGVDPFAAQKQAESDAELAEAHMQAAQGVCRGAGARGAVRGAAAGALIGEIAGNDVGNSAGWGAAAGVLHGRRAKRQAQREASTVVAAQSTEKQAASAEDIANFKKAFSACLEAKKYMVKY